MRISTDFTICDFYYELAAYVYFGVRLNHWQILFSRLTNGLYQYRIVLPFLRINNTEYRRQVSTKHGGKVIASQKIKFFRKTILR